MTSSNVCGFACSFTWIIYYSYVCQWYLWKTHKNHSIMFVVVCFCSITWYAFVVVVVVITSDFRYHNSQFIHWNLFVDFHAILFICNTYSHARNAFLLHLLEMHSCAYESHVSEHLNCVPRPTRESVCKAHIRQFVDFYFSSRFIVLFHCIIKNNWL